MAYTGRGKGKGKRESIEQLLERAQKANREELGNIYLKLAKRANERMRQIEKLSLEKGFEEVTQFAYKEALKNIAALGGRGKRFTKAISGSKRRLQQQTAAVAKFLQAETSKVGGIKELYQQRLKTFNENNGVNFTGAQMADFFRWQEQNQRFKYESATKMQASVRIYEAQMDKKKLEESIARLQTNADKTQVDIIQRQLMKEAFPSLWKEIASDLAKYAKLFGL